MLVARYSEMKVSERSTQLPESLKEMDVHLEPNLNHQKKKRVRFANSQSIHTQVLYLKLGATTDSILSAFDLPKQKIAQFAHTSLKTGFKGNMNYDCKKKQKGFNQKITFALKQLFSFG
ncbi:uncharacterized protein PGTG_02328 [Puccinia graminis f. sp. tritici CRL 75-36-700-3]|uniref:Uncharacterized protein n=1 Tax=Puccinia graminis f. sp. tritici (strain CRL 75-36-700-3 / race SCCL) TaxID=418459 RepID=E3JXU2_PUCGT|nr:uncharacterized protein PGTG_02328 [Puccinia graminis f. sp. tritici CRL 75-36-700-3]EFP76867.2 hypothetical protein PGTG_02328 [Puccinia graminis f. sp. tritici CRL 75-36-700-3]